MKHEKPVIKATFVYVGPEEETEVFGVVFKRGEKTEVTNETYLGERALEKLEGNQLFQKVS